LKPENVLFTEDEIVKICDFGSSKFINKNTKSTPYIVSRYYRSPELILGSNTYDSKIDIFATGCILAELFNQTPLFPGKSEGLQLFEQMCVLGTPPMSYFSKFNIPTDYINFFKSMDEIIPTDVKKLLNKSKKYDEDDVRSATDLLLKLVAWDPSDRFTAEEALKHAFLSKK
jgi:serine/threonine protein kinase